MTKPALAALLCLCAIWLTGCSGSDEPVITVYNAPDMGVDTFQQVPVMATVEPTPIPTADPNSDEDVAWGLAGLDFTPQEAINPADLPSDIVIGYVARENTAIGPYECTERDLISLNGLMFESVVELDAEQKPVPLLADRWVGEKDSNGNIKWTFQLRDGIKFHNGAPLTAQDVVDSYTAIIAAGEMKLPGKNGIISDPDGSYTGRPMDPDDLEPGMTATAASRPEIDYGKLAEAIESRPVVIQADTSRVFKVVRNQNKIITRSTNWNALGAATT